MYKNKEEFEHDKIIMRSLAIEYRKYAFDPRNDEIIELYKAVNDLHMIRPVVTIFEEPWNELNFDGSLTIQCTDTFVKTVEQMLRRDIMKAKYFPADNVFVPYIRIQKVIHSTGFGLVKSEETIPTDYENDIVSHHYENQLEHDEDIEKLHFEDITYNKVESERRVNLIDEMVGDIIPVLLKGQATGYELGVITWDTITENMGVSNLLMDLILRPDFLKDVALKLDNIYTNTLYQYEELDLLDGDAMYCHCSPAPSNDLDNLHPRKNDDKVRAQNLWGRGLAQIFTSVSKQMHNEFDIDFMIDAMKPYGFCYYGCCEALDTKVDIVKRIPNVRKIMMSPWADIDRGAEAIGKDYVCSTKPNPANLAMDHLDKKLITREIDKIMNAWTRNGSNAELLLKDISTINHNPQNLIDWNNIVMDIIKG